MHNWKHQFKLAGQHWKYSYQTRLGHQIGVTKGSRGIYTWIQFWIQKSDACAVQPVM